MKLHHPLPITLLRVVQFITALIVMGLCIWSACWYGMYVGYYVTFWSAFWTLIFMIFRALEHCASHNWLHITALCIEALVVLSWLVSTITLAILNVSLHNWEKRWEAAIDVYYHGSSLDTIFTDTGRATLKGSYAANGLAGALFVSFVISFGVYVHTYRKAKREHAAKGPGMQQNSA